VDARSASERIKQSARLVVGRRRESRAVFSGRSPSSSSNPSGAAMRATSMLVLIPNFFSRGVAEKSRGGAMTGVADGWARSAARVRGVSDHAA
jgi:hypothetical protein